VAVVEVDGGPPAEIRVEVSLGTEISPVDTAGMPSRALSRAA